MFGISREDIRHIVIVNYILIAVETAFGFALVYVFHAFPMWLLAVVFILVLIPNIILHIAILLDAKHIVLEALLLFLALLFMVAFVCA